MKKGSAGLLGWLLLLGLGLFGVSCALIETAPPPLPAASIVPPAIPHSLEGRSDCRLCHEAGVGGAPRFPVDHGDRPSDICRTCHQETTAGTGTDVAEPVPSSQETAAKPDPTSEPAMAISAAELYAARCGVCHGETRQGVSGLGGALTAQSTASLDDMEMKQIISNGRPGTSMPAFEASLSPIEIDALVELIKYGPTE